VAATAVGKETDSGEVGWEAKRGVAAALQERACREVETAREETDSEEAVDLVPVPAARAVVVVRAQETEADSKEEAEEQEVA
jgi:hypothetical protein